MYRTIVPFLIVIFTFWPSYAQNTLKIGVIDGEKLFDVYPGVQDAQKKISEAQNQLRDAIDESEKIYSEFEKQKKSDAEKLTKKKELQDKIDTKTEDTKKLIESVSIKIEKDILDAVKSVSQEKALDVVFDKRAVLIGGLDVTDNVVEVLRKKPYAFADTQEPSSEKVENTKKNKENKKTN